MKIKLKDKNGVTLKTKDKLCNEDIQIVLDESISGGGIEEVSELPVASAENVGKIYKYQGQLYECKEVLDVCVMFNVPYSYVKATAQDGKKSILYLADSEPNEEDMLQSSETEEHIYILSDGTKMFLNMGEKMEMPLNGILPNWNIPLIEGYTAIHYYEFEMIDSNLWDVISLVGYQKTMIVPKKITYLKENALKGMAIEKLVFTGTLYHIAENAITSAILKTIDLSNTTFVVDLSTNGISDCEMLQEIKVPMALLEEFKTATNWSAYADIIVGV